MSSKSGIRKKTKDCGRLKPAKPASAMNWISREETSNTSQKGEGSAQTSNSAKQMGEGEGSVQRSNDAMASSSSARDECRDAIIAYVHKVSESRRNKRNTMDYSTMVLQTSSDTQLPALIYSKTKRKLLVDSERSRTPVKLQRFTYTSDGSKVIVNDMTKISSPQPTEYSFQFEEVGSNDEEQRMAVREIIDNSNEGDLMSIRGKIVGVAEPTVTKSRGLKVANALFADETGKTELDLWEGHISAVEVGCAYTISHVQARRWLGKKKVSTVVSSTITAEEMNECLSAIPLATEEEIRGGFASSTLTIRSFQCVEKVESYLQCRKCSRKILQAMGTPVVRCDRCGYSMRTVDCPVRRYASVVMEVTDGSPVHVTVFNDVLEKLVPDCKNLTGGEVEEMLLLMENVTITYNSDTCIVLNAVAAK